MAKITVISKKGDDLAGKLGFEIKGWFEQRGVNVFLLENVAHHAQRAGRESFALQIEPDSLAVVVL